MCFQDRIFGGIACMGYYYLLSKLGGVERRCCVQVVVVASQHFGGFVGMGRGCCVNVVLVARKRSSKAVADCSRCIQYFMGRIQLLSAM